MRSRSERSWLDPVTGEPLGPVDEPIHSLAHLDPAILRRWVHRHDCGCVGSKGVLNLPSQGLQRRFEVPPQVVPLDELGQVVGVVPPGGCASSAAGRT